jgi:redox-sensitive bicupin YhaK (pirin superfamily)
LIEPHEKDLGDFTVRRLLPAAQQRSVGPFVFFDHMGPADFSAGRGINVRPHPHIGLATVTYLFEGEILHRDSLGYVQAIQPGAVNLMTAGRGIVHSERTSAERRARGQRLNGIQIWMALPLAQEESEPAFVHYPSGELPTFESRGVRGTVVVGAAFGARSPVATASRTLYLDAQLAASSTWDVPMLEAELAVYVADGAVRIGDVMATAGTMAVLSGAARQVADVASRVVVIGGDNLGPRHLWWNFVSSSRDRIDRAARDWEGRRFTHVPGDDERIPLPPR